MILSFAIACAYNVCHNRVMVSRIHRIIFRVSKAEYASIQKEAEKLGHTVSAYLRWLHRTHVENSK